MRSRSKPETAATVAIVKRGGSRDVRGFKRLTLLAVGMACVAMLATACGSSSKNGTGGGGSSGTSANGSFKPTGTKIAGGTVTWAEGPGASPNYIFPLYSAQVCSVANASQFQPLMYRSLYWYGNGNKATVDYDYSIGNQPTWSADGKTVTVTMKQSYKWSDGEAVNANDVIFWMNLLKANTANWCPYVSGGFPDNVVSYKATGPYTVQFTLNKAYNQTWFLYNELSQVTPLPIAWDVTSASQTPPTTYSTSLPDTTNPTGVYNYLNGLAKNTGTYATSKVWAVVDGPFKLSNFTNTGEADFVPNSMYGGPVKAQVNFKELPYTAEAPEVALAHTGPANLTIGWLPVDDSPQLGALKSSGYVDEAAYTFSTDYFPLNLNNPTVGPIFKQTYFRQAFEHLINQSGWISAFEKGFAQPQYGIVPVNPSNTFVSPNGAKSQYPFSVSAAKQLLTSHGWKVVPNGTTTCTNPGTGANQCGTGVKAGQAISFNLDYMSGATFLDSEMKDLKANAAQVGIQLQLTTHTFNTVISTAVQCKPTDANCKWQSENWGGGWIYSPDFYPTGEEIIQTGAAANYSNYSDPHMDSLIQATTTASPAQAQSELNTYQDYVQQQLPVVFQPNTSGNPVPGGATLIDKHLGGFSINAYTYITPEQYYFTK